MKTSDYDGRGYDPPYENDAVTMLRELSDQLEAERELVSRVQRIVDVACRLVDHQRNTASTMPTEHCEAHIDGRMRLREELGRAVDDYRKWRKP